MNRELYERVCVKEVTMYGDNCERTSSLCSSLQEETFSIPESSTPSSEAPSTSNLPSDGIISELKGSTLSSHGCVMVSLFLFSLSGPMSESTMSPKLGPSPTAVFSPEPTTIVSPEPTTVVSPEPTTVVSPEPVPETSSGTSTDHTSTVLNSSGLGPEPTMVNLVSPASVGPEPISLSLEPGSNHVSSGSEPVSVPLEPTRTAEEEEEEEAVVPLPSEPIHTADKTVKEEGQERKEVKEERGKKVKEGRKTKEGKKGKKEEKDEVAAKPAQEEEQKPSSGKHHIHV